MFRIGVFLVLVVSGFGVTVFGYPGQACATDDDCSGFSGFPETCQNGACHGQAGLKPGQIDLRRLKLLMQPKGDRTECGVPGTPCSDDNDCCSIYYCFDGHQCM